MSNFCNFLQRSARFCTLLSIFCKFLRSFAPLFRRFFLAPFTHVTHASNRHLFIDQNRTSLWEETKKTAIFPPFLKFKKFHFSIMLICAILSTVISTVTKNRVFVLRQYKLADAPVAGQFQRQIPSALQGWIVQVPLAADIIFSEFGVLLLTTGQKSRKLPLLYLPVVLNRLFEGIS